MIALIFGDMYIRGGNDMFRRFNYIGQNQLQIAIKKHEQRNATSSKGFLHSGVFSIGL